MHETKGQPAPDRAQILKGQGLVVVRGPSYNATKAPHVLADANPKSNSVPLTIETPSTADDSYVESDDSAHDQSIDDENVDHQNINTNRKSSVSQSRKSLQSNTIIAEDNSKPKKSPAKSFRLKSRKSKNSLKRQPTSENVLQPRNSNAQQTSNLSAQDTSAIPTPPESDHSSEAPEEHIQDHMDNTPKELLAPIMVPRMSGAFPDSKRILSDNRKQSRSLVESPAISSETWLPSDSSQRYEDVEGDNSSGLISMSTVGKEKVIHKATYSPARAPLTMTSPRGVTPALRDASSQSTVSQSMRSRRKSKPYVSSSGTIDTSVPVLASLDSFAMDRLDEEQSYNETGTIPEPAVLSRQISVGVMSDDIQVIDTPALSSKTESNGVASLITPSPREAARQRIHDDPLDLPSATAQPQGIIRRASSTKRKTVSFHTASPTIIEPNLRAPASVPRSALLFKDSWRASDVPRKPISALSNARDSVALAASPIPQTMDTNTISISRQQDRQDSFTSEDTFQERSSRRMSTRVLVKDRNELREASKRQSRAVAAAMADQIKGVPKSAMLAFSENEIELAESFEESEQDSSLSSLRRKSRASKTIRMPEFIPGVVPAPPPPPPFIPDMPRARSIRTPPPPPASPLPH